MWIVYAPWGYAIYGPMGAIFVGYVFAQYLLQYVN
jgi:hypothetical protein